MNQTIQQYVNRNHFNNTTSAQAHLLIIDKLSAMGYETILTASVLDASAPPTSEADLIAAGLDTANDSINFNYDLKGQDAKGLHNVAQSISMFFDGTSDGFSKWMNDLGLNPDPSQIPGVQGQVKQIVKQFMSAVPLVPIPNPVPVPVPIFELKGPVTNLGSEFSNALKALVSIKGAPPITLAIMPDLTAWDYRGIDITRSLQSQGVDVGQILLAMQKSLGG